MPQRIDDGFIPDEDEGFIEDLAFIPDEDEKPNKFTPVNKYDRPDTLMFRIDPDWWERGRIELANKIATSDYIPEMLKPRLATMQQLGVEGLRVLTDFFSAPEAVITPGVLRSGTRLPKISPEIPQAPRPQRMLSEGRGPGLETDPFIASEAGRVQRQSLITPQEDARLAGFDFTTDVEGRAIPAGIQTNQPPARFTDLSELREQERLKRLFFTEHEQAGGSSLELPDAPNMSQPPYTGDTRLGFDATTKPGGLNYPLDFMPEAVQPRTSQTVTRALAGDDFARSVLPEERMTFGNEIAPEITQASPVEDFFGGTKSMQPGEPILPSAPIKPLREKTKTSPHIQEVEKPVNPMEDKIDVWTAKNVEPAISGVSAEIAPISAQNRSTMGRLADELLISGEKQLEKMGPVGQDIRKLLSQVEFSKRELYNKFAGPFENATKNLAPEEVDIFVQLMDGSAKPLSISGIEQPITLAVQNAVNQARQVTNLMGEMAEQAGVHLKTPSGKIVPFKPIKEYWPHRPVNPVGRSNFIDELITRNPKLSRSQAQRLAKQFQNESEWFNSPQHSRMFGEFEFRRDLNAMIDHIADMSDIISRAKILGSGDIGNKNSIISKIIEQTPLPARAHDIVRTHLRGGMDKNDGFYQAVKSANNIATKSQVFTKLSLFPISNLNNQLQTMLHGNLTEFAKSLTSSISGSPTLKNLAKEYGTIAVGDIPVGILSEAGKRQVPIVGGLVKWADDWARVIATGTGKGTSNLLFKAAQNGDKMATRKLQNLLLENDMSKILQQNKLTPEQEKFATQRFVELAQQLNSNVKLPPAWVNEPLLHIPLIFKRFSFQGTKSVKDAIMQDPIRNIPLFLIASPLLGELTGDLKSIVYGVVRGAPSPDGMLDAIAFELSNRHKFAESLTSLDSESSDVEWLANRLTADILQSWGLGLVADVLQGALGGKAGGYSAAFGPFIDQAISLITGGFSLGQNLLTGDIEGAQTPAKALGREGLRSLPVVGPGLQRRLLPTEFQEIEP